MKSFKLCHVTSSKSYMTSACFQSHALKLLVSDSWNKALVFVMVQALASVAIYERFTDSK